MSDIYCACIILALGYYVGVRETHKTPSQYLYELQPTHQQFESTIGKRPSISSTPNWTKGNA